VIGQPGSKGFDAAVIGLGAAGCWAVKTLTENGLRVVALDAGRLLSPTDLPRDVKLTSHLRKILLGGKWIQSRSMSFHPSLRHLYIDDKSNPYSTRGGETFLWIRGRQVGGRLHTWARMALRLSEADFERRDPDGPGPSWPISYADLSPYYDRVEEFHGLRGARDGLPVLPDGQVSEVGELTEAAALFKCKIEQRWPARRVIVPRTLRDSIHPIPAPLQCALETKRLELITDAPASRILLNDAGDRAVGVEYVDARERRQSTVSADLVVLCASCIESIRILMHSRTTRRPQGVGNDHDQLGRYILDHNLVVATGSTGDEYQELAGSSESRPVTPLDLRSALDFYIPDFSATLKDRSFSRGFGIQGRISPKQWSMAAFGEMLAHADNRVTLSNRKDAFGIPTANISLRRRHNDLNMIEAQRQEIRMMADAADLQIEMPLPRLLRAILWKAVGPKVGVMHLGMSIHETGGARMGLDPRTSVTNSRNQVWGVPNLLVTDGACFPGSGCQNPTLTIMALTARACELALSGTPSRSSAG
jgi:choline dehydrogenase-like flavoprotein